MRTDRSLVPVPHNWHYCARSAVLLARVLEESSYELVVLSHLWMSHYIPVVRRHSTARLLLDLHNAEADLQEEMSSHPNTDLLEAVEADVELTDLEYTERQAIREADMVTVPSAQDRERLARRYRLSTPIMVVPNAVPVFQDSRPSAARAPQTAFFLGTLDYFANTQAAVKMFEGIGPAITEAVPGLRVVVAGRRPPRLLRQIARDSEVYLASDLVDVRPLFRDSVLVVPLEVGGGSRLKILEAFSAGCSVVSSAKGMEGIDAVPDVHYVPAEDSEGFAWAVAAVVADPEADLRRRQAAWELVRTRYSWEAAVRSVAEVVRSARSLGFVTEPKPAPTRRDSADASGPR
jgi:glycosyltransferase involved in cell wall biosynthesis